MRVPSVKTIATVWPEHAKAIRAVLTMPAVDVNAHPLFVAELESRGVNEYGRPSYAWIPLQERRLYVISHMVGAYGVERAGRVCDYVNTGDTYSGTILWRRDRACYQVSTRGDAVEAYERRHGYGSADRGQS